MSEVLRILKDGYWDTTSVVRGPDGALRVRKESKRSDTPGPWARRALRNEIAFLASLPDSSRPHFPPLLASWDGDSIGYEIPYYASRSDAAKLVLANALGQEAADSLQRELAEIVFGGIHQPVPETAPRLADHVREVLAESIDALAEDARFRPLIEERTVVVNGAPVPGLRRSFRRLVESDLLARLASAPVVRLHGDLILENILLPSPLLLIDPVSVAGIDRGHPLFDLVKYESYAGGELYAIREELVTAGPAGDGSYRFEIPAAHPRLAPFRRIDLTSTFRAAYERTHGSVDPGLYALLDAYFSLVMARNTTGTHQWARVVKATLTLAQAAGDQ